MKEKEEVLPICICIGLALGAGIGAAIHNVSLGMSSGLLTGSGIGMILTLLKTPNRPKWTKFFMLFAVVMILGSFVLLFLEIFD